MKENTARIGDGHYDRSRNESFPYRWPEINNMVQLRLHNGRYYANAQVLNAYNFMV